MQPRRPHRPESYPFRNDRASNPRLLDSSDPSHLLEQASFVRNVAGRMVSDEHDAEDLAQDTLLAALQKPPHSLREPRAWLFAVARNLARRSVRTRQRQESCLQRSKERRTGTRSPFPSSPEFLAGREMARRLLESLCELPEPYRSALVEKFYFERSVTEIARETATPVETIRTRIKRGLQVLRSRMDDSEKGDWRTVLLPFLFPGLSDDEVTPGNLRRATEASPGLPRLGWTLGALVIAMVFLLGPILHRLEREESLPTGSDGETETVQARAASSKPRRSDPEDSTRPVPPLTSSSQVSAIPTRTKARKIHLEWPGGLEAAPGVRGRLIPASEDERKELLPAGQDLDLVSDSDGILTIPSNFPTNSRLELGRVREESWPRVDELLQLTRRFELPPGIDLDITVLDVDGNPVAEADVVFATWLRISDRGHVVGRTDDRGTLRVRAVSRNGYLGARASGWASSPLLHVDGTSRTGSEKLTLRFRTEECHLLGCVLDPSGAGVGNAQILVDHEDDVYGADGMKAGPWSATSDRDGHFSIGGLVPGKKKLFVFTSGAWAPLHTSVDVTRDSKVTLTLREATTIVGVVEDGRGVPVPGALLSVEDSALDSLRWPVETESDADGRFSVPGLVPGSVRIQIENRVFRTVLHTTVDEGINDRRIRVDEGSRIRGQVIDEDGHPLENFRVEAWWPRPDARTKRGTISAMRIIHQARGSDRELERCWRGLERAETTTSTDGSFVLFVEGDKPNRLEILGPPGSPDVSLATNEGVRPDGPDLVLRVKSPKPGRVLASVRSGDGPRDECEFQLSPDPTGLDPIRTRPGLANRVAFGEVPPGRYTVLASAPELGRILRPPFQLSPGEELDLGEFVFRNPGTLRAQLRVPAEPLTETRTQNRSLTMLGDSASRWGGLSFRVTSPDGQLAATTRHDGFQISAGPLQPGNYLLVAQAGVESAWGCTAIPFEIVEDRETLLDFPLNPGRCCQLLFQTKASDSRLIGLDLHGGNGETILRLRGSREVDPVRPGLMLLPGSYRLGWHWSSGASRETLFEVGSDTAHPLIIEADDG